LRPILLNLFHYPIYSYPLFLGLSFGSAYYYSLSALQGRKVNLFSFRMLFIGIFISAWVGAKLFFLLHTSKFPMTDAGTSVFWLGGGFVFYGGLIFATLFALFYSLMLKRFDLKDLIFCLPALPLAHAIGRVGCFLAGCCFGSESSFWWMNRHPVQLFEAIGNLCIFFILRSSLSKLNMLLIPFMYFFSYSFLRFFLEFFRADQARGIYLNLLSSAQVTSLALLGLGSLVYLGVRKKIN
jgi:phosphatidylglycerol:prolipoprotein diacylglycerol transferase